MPSSSIAELLQKALTLHRAGAVAAATAAYGEVLHGDPSNSDAHYYLAMISCQSGRFAEGADLARKSLAVDPQHARAHVLLGRASGALGQREEALASFDRAITLAPDLPEAHSHRADALSALGRNVEAIESYDRALTLVPDLIEDRFNRAAALSIVGRNEEAISSLDYVNAARPEFAQAHVLRAKVVSDIGRQSEALYFMFRSTGRRCPRSSRSSQQTTSNFSVSTSTRRSGASSPRGLRIQGRRPISIAGTPSNAMRRNPLSACIGFG
jgi:tetratricopeptide (TPR) repeat protein